MKKLFEKGYIGACQIKNRVVVPPMTTGFAGKNGQPTEQLMRYLEARAKGGVGLIISEIFCVNQEHGHALGNQLCATDFDNLPSLARMTARIHKYDSKIFAQLHHGGSTNNPAINNGKLYAPSAIPNASGLMPEPFTLEQIEELKQQFIMTAVLCKATDFDGVELHCAHGYLFCEFLSASSNTREDQYGGSLENRCRLIVEIIQGIKAACGPDFPVVARISANEYDPDHAGSLTLEETVQIAKILEAAGADALDISAGNYFSKYGEMIEPYSYSQGWRKANAKAIKDAVNVPVIAVNTIKEPEYAEQLLEEGVSDFVGIGRANIADPDWTKKAKLGCTNEIRKCIGCLYCFESLNTLGYVRCTVNPRVGREECFSEQLNKNGAGRKLAVVGGGPAGMQASALLAERGFDVTLFEKAGELGGAMNLANKTAPYKEKITWFRDTLAGEMEKAGVDVRLNTEATVDAVKALNPEAVFLTGGAKPICPPLPGVTGKNVVQANDVVSGKVKVSGKVAIIGSGLTGLETAELLSHSDDVKSICVADMLPTIGATIYATVFADVMHQFGPVPVEMYAGHKLESIDETGATLLRVEDQTSVKIDADYVILALGLKPDKDVIKQFEDAFDRVVVLGENKTAPGRISTAISDAYIVAHDFDPLV